MDLLNNLEPSRFAEIHFQHYCAHFPEVHLLYSILSRYQKHHNIYPESLHISQDCNQTKRMLVKKVNLGISMTILSIYG